MGRTEQGVAQSRDRYQVIPRVLCFVLRDEQVLLLRGAPTKRIWPNRYNGLGGHVEQDEDVYTAALREIHEESGLDVRHLRLRGVINIDVGEPVGIMLFVFLADAHTTTPRPSPEGTLEWVRLDELGQYDLVEDIEVILPQVLAADKRGDVFFAHYTYDDRDTLTITWRVKSTSDEPLSDETPAHDTETLEECWGG